MVRDIPKDGRVVRVTRNSLMTLQPYDSDVNLGIQKMQKKVEELTGPKGEFKTGTGTPSVTPAHVCRFDEGKMKEIVKETMETVIAPFTGGGT